VAAVLVMAGLFVVATRLVGASTDSPSRTPGGAPVSTAPMSTAATATSASAEDPQLTGELVPGPHSTGCAGRRSPVLRVLQFNIRAGRSDSGAVDLAEIAAEIEAVHPDLVSLNEVDTDTSRTRADEPAVLAGATGFHVVYGPNLVYDGGPFGNAVLSRYPVLDSRNLRLPGRLGLEPRGLLTVVVRVDGRRVWFSSTHLSDGNDGRPSRTLQALAMLQAVHRESGPVIVAGDLNSVPTDLPVRILRQRLLDAQEQGGTGVGDTIPQESPRSRIDVEATISR
jgi:endonuclease/exonuclease/phosphatase family metal-dependent hydrolase